MRIVGGKFAGRDLTSPGHSRVRPTSEHVRAALLDHLRPDLDGARVLDLFAGTGALGLEALSRGAKSADFVEMNHTSLHALKANVAKFRLKDRARIFVKDAIHFADALPPGRYDLCLADPPYESKQLDWLIRIWQERRFSRILAVEHAASHELPRGQAHLSFETSSVTIYRLPTPVAEPAEDAAEHGGAPSEMAPPPLEAPRPRSPRPAVRPSAGAAAGAERRGVSRAAAKGGAKAGAKRGAKSLPRPKRRPK
jgi:16S rRNA (guanine966-N2)-methyltransferase